MARPRVELLELSVSDYQVAVIAVIVCALFETVLCATKHLSGRFLFVTGPRSGWKVSQSTLVP